MKKQANPGADYFSIKDTFMDPQLPIQNCFMKWVHDSTRGVEGYHIEKQILGPGLYTRWNLNLIYYHGPTKKYVNKERRAIWSSWKFVKKEWFLTSLCRIFWTKMEIRLQWSRWSQFWDLPWNIWRPNRSFFVIKVRKINQ